MTDAREIEDHLQGARTEAIRTLAAATDLSSLEEAQARVLGRRSELAAARQSLAQLDEDDRRRVGRTVTEVQRELEQEAAARRDKLLEAELRQRWDRERLDVTLPGTLLPTATIHPLTSTMWEIIDVFVGLGYTVADGPEIELSRYNFDALNTPAHHPGRSPTDTFYIEGTNERVCLRTQTSPVQIRAMEAQDPPVYVVAPGRCYRRDTVDATHLAGFTQIEGLAVDEAVSMSDLKGTLQAFAQKIFGKNLDVRFRPHFFPFTEPSAEMDVHCFKCMGAGCRLCKNEGWIEILGAGMVHPFLLDWVGYDTERYTGFAFGLGIERVAALAHGVGDIRAFWENDLRFLEQFGGRR